MNDKEFNKYLGIANHDIQVANNHEELKSYVASILFEQDKLQSNWNSLREWLENEIKQEHHTKHWDILDKMNELEGVNNSE